MKEKQVKKRNTKNEDMVEKVSNAKIIVVSLILALMISVVAYVQISNKNKKNEEDKKSVPVEKTNDKVDTVEKDNTVSQLDTVEPVKTAKVEKVVNEEVPSEDIYYAITFESNGGSKIDKQILTSKEITYNEIPTKDGWVFGGWFTDETFENKYKFGFKLESDITLYAKWLKKVLYIVDNQQSDIENFITVGEVIPLLTKEDLGIVDDSFEIEWEISNEDEFGNIEYSVIKDNCIFDDEDSSDEAIVLTMARRANFEVAFYESEQSQTAIMTKMVTEGRVIDFTDVNAKVEQDLSRTDFGWYYLDNELNKFDFAYGSVANVNITKMYLSDVYVVTYNEEADEEDEETFEKISEQKVSKDSKITDILKPEEKEDKTFDGWYIIDDETSAITDEKLIEGTVISKDINVVAKWQDVEPVDEIQVLDEPIEEELPQEDETVEKPLEEEQLETEEGQVEPEVAQETPEVQEQENN